MAHCFWSFRLKYDVLSFSTINLLQMVWDVEKLPLNLVKGKVSESFHLLFTLLAIHLWWDPYSKSIFFFFNLLALHVTFLKSRSD